MIRYRHLDEVALKLQGVKKDCSNFDNFLRAKVDYFINGDKDFIYKNDIGKVWKEYLLEGQARL